MKGFDVVAACFDKGFPNAVRHCRAEPVTRPNNLVGSAANQRPMDRIDLAIALISAFVAPNRRAASSSGMKCRYLDDVGVATWAAACSRAFVAVGSDR